MLVLMTILTIVPRRETDIKRKKVGDYAKVNI